VPKDFVGQSGFGGKALVFPEFRVQPHSAGDVTSVISVCAAQVEYDYALVGGRIVEPIRERRCLDYAPE
jgi:hypothetical protein